MEDAFGTLIWIVAGAGVVIAIFTLLKTGRTYREIGGGGLVRDGDGSQTSQGGSAAAQRDEEIRQMLEARNARRARRGEPELDIAAQVAALHPPPADPALREEVRQLVIARNHRRARRGEPPLDVESETERRLEDMK